MSDGVAFCAPGACAPAEILVIESVAVTVIVAKPVMRGEIDHEDDA